ncbi:MAG TPA: SurA N-terminal domain-containing protein, partial [Flavisolibacter sp.]|nr:SurA N-terminal domain-containing protein [Flavisolibacter sp.]
MSLIQKIRDKGALISAIVIAIALLGFILMDAFSGRTGIGSASTTVGKINGKEIEYVDFDRKVKAQEAAAKAQGYDQGEAGRQQAIESVWEGEVSQRLMEEEFEKLGMTIGKKELNDILFGMNPPQDLKQRFTDPNTGQYDAVQAQQFINQLRKTGTPEDRAQLNDYLGSLEINRMMEKYN